MTLGLSFMSDARSIGVLIPTRNCASLIPAHLDSLRAWVDLAEEIVVVDSYSKDRTVDLLQAGLSHPQVTYLTYPPGLYQSWNYGLRHLNSEYCYISTVGDSITRAGLDHLRQTMEALSADVAVSKPAFITENGRPMKAPRWPIDDLIRTQGRGEPFGLEGAALFLFALVHYREALLGSSASNLYRTSCLQENPFPTGFGTVGDGAWGLANCCKIRLGVTQKVFSTFRDHAKAYARSEYAVDELSHKLLQRILDTWSAEKEKEPLAGAIRRGAPLSEILPLLREQLGFQEQLERSRQGAWPWIFSRSAWAARVQRNRLKRKIKALKLIALERIATTNPPGPI
jgi:hypothetical protein